MKILYCIPGLYNSGGMERVLTNKVNYLVNCVDYEIFIITTDGNEKKSFFELDSRVKIENFNLNYDSHFNKPLIQKFFIHQFKQNQYKKKLLNFIQTNKIDICISLCGKEVEFLGELEVECVKIVEVHFSLLFRKQFMVSHFDGFIWEHLGELRNKQLIRNLSKFDKVVVLTKDEEGKFKNNLRNIICIPNPVSIPTNLTPISQNNKSVISVGRLDEQKGYDNLLLAWLLVNKSYPDWKLFIYGEGDKRLELESFINNNNMNEVIFLPGRTNNVFKLFSESSIFVLSSRYEGLPMVLIEAMAYGMPAVSFDCETGPREIINDNVDGLLVENQNVECLAAKLMYLIDNETLRKKIGETAYVNIKRFDIENIMPRWINLFKSFK